MKGITRLDYLQAIKENETKGSVMDNRRNNGSVRSSCRSKDRGTPSHMERGHGFDDPNLPNKDLIYFIKMKISNKFKYFYKSKNGKLLSIIDSQESSEGSVDKSASYSEVSQVEEDGSEESKGYISSTSISDKNKSNKKRNKDVNSRSQEIKKLSSQITKPKI